MRNRNSIKNILVFFVVIAGSMVNVLAETPAGEEILAKSWQAMGVAAHYKILAKGMEMSVYQKPLPDGSIAMLTDISTPIKKTTIKYGDKSYDLYLDKKIAIDTKVLFAGVTNQPEFASLLSAAKEMKAEVKLIRTFTYNEKECYAIEQIIQTPASMLANVLPAIAKNLPAKNRFVIDVKTFLIQEQESFSSDGTSLSKLQYLDFEPMPDLTDEIFQLPEGFEVLSPKSLREYGDLLFPKINIPRLPPLVAPPPDLTHPNQFNASDEDIFLPDNKKRNRIVIIVINIVVIIALIATRLLWRYWSKNTSKKNK